MPSYSHYPFLLLVILYSSSCILHPTASFSSFVPNTLVPPLLNTSSGFVSGVYQQTNDGNYLIAYLSIPYATPPVNNLRWQPPLPPYPWYPSIFNASSLGSPCIQPGGAGKEDCLTLSLYIPCHSTDIQNCPTSFSPSSATPIFFYIHGGGLMGGAGVYETPQMFAVRTRTIAITINYRLNIFGFLATSALTEEQQGTSGNYGILDQQLALRWVQENAGNFGGDPHRVTVAGQSSGGTSIFALLASTNSRGLFQRAIALSGSPNITISLPTAEQQNNPISVSLGCRNPSNSTLEMLCMRSKTVNELVTVIPSCWNTPGIFGMPYNPDGFGWCGLPIVDGQRINIPFKTAMETGLVDVPLIMGNMAQETTAPADIGNITTWRDSLPTIFQEWGNATVNLAESVYNLYLSDALMDPGRAYSSFNADFGVGCAFREIGIAAKQTGNYQSPIVSIEPYIHVLSKTNDTETEYVYVNQWQPSVPLVNGNTYRTWVYHTWDYHTAFEDFNGCTAYYPNTTFPNPLDYELAHYLQSVWGQLMYNGTLDPNLSAGWKSIEQVPHFPTTGGIQLISSALLPPYIPNSFIEDYHGDHCTVLGYYGFDERFWWCD